MKRRVRRVVLSMVLLLTAGAIINVAVAWGCASLSQPSQIVWPDDEGGAFDAQFADRATFGIETVRGTGFACRLFYEDRQPQPDKWRGTPPHKTFAMTTETGWPLAALCGAQLHDTSGKPFHATEFLDGKVPVANEDLYLVTIPAGLFGDTARFVPLCPLWPGFAINTVFYAAILWGLFAAPFALRRRRRIKRGLCPKCAYPVGTNQVCTECGAAVATQP